MLDVEKLGGQLVTHEKEQNEEKAEYHLHVNVGSKSDDAKYRQPKHLKESIKVNDFLRNAT